MSESIVEPIGKPGIEPSIEPRVLKGFRDYLPDAELARSALMRALEGVFRSFGFVPIDTPVLEYAEILLGKGGGETDKQVYRFRDNGGRDVAMRFDLTVPFARFMAEHADELYLPFRRYHMAKAWRGENTQRGRYREFIQCDFDIVGVDSAAADADILLTIAHSMRALDVGAVRIRINHRGMFNRFLAARGISGHSVAVLRIVDKLEKIGRDETSSLLAELTGAQNAQAVLDFITPEASFTDTLEKMYAACASGDAAAQAAKTRLEEVWEIALASGTADSLVLDPSITRGLDYYTGLVVETFLVDLPQIGSICSGGRYNELASLYTTKNLPGVGASVGLDRLLAAQEALQRSSLDRTVTQILIVNTDPGLCALYQRAAADLRAQGLCVEVYPEPKKLMPQYTYAERKHIPYALVLDQNAQAKGLWPLRTLALRSTQEYPSLQALKEALE